MRSDIQKIISGHKVCVMATVADGAPHCSLMSYATDSNCREIYMATLKDTKKYRNLIANLAVSLLIDTRDANQKGNTRALTVTGVFQAAGDNQKTEDIRNALIKKHPDLNDFFNHPEARIIVIRVTALQLLDNVTDAYFEEVN
jgi:nitroimidazol reductase NimA-like FMN-containing flavoprotein (pyridoxamine 5'-phosphate oxidase superfamily)